VGVNKIIDPPYTHRIMPKSLGQIHSVDYYMPVSASGNRFNIDIPGQLTEQLQTMVRAGTYQKVVGIDMNLTAVGTVGGGQVTGHILYYAPTSGRCEAFRAAFDAMKAQMKIQGVTPQNNPLYDFRVPINNAATVNPLPFPNHATLDGTTGLALFHGTEQASVFGVHNRSVQPTYEGTAGDLYPAGFNTLLAPGSGPAARDFVLNDTVPFTGNRDTASTDYQKIPFSLSYTPDSTDLTLTLEWRPDPALFIAVMCGQMQVFVEEINKDGGAGTLELNISVMVSGWKSIMGDPKKKKSSTRKKVKS